MKRIVAFIMPLPAEAAAQEPPILQEAKPSQNGDSKCEHVFGEGEMKIEATASDTLAQRIIAALLEQENESAEESSLRGLVEKEIHIAGPEAHDLHKRIVVGVERELISRVYSECNRVKTRAAARLGIDRNTLHKKLRQYHLADD